MALAECKLLALLTLVGAMFLLANALPFHHHGPGAALADLLLAALDRLRGVDVVGLATRRNMVLLCHAILLLVLRDAGLLGTPAPRRRRSASDVSVASAAGCFYSPPERSPARSVVVWRRRNRAVPAPNAKEAAVDEMGCHLKRQRRRGTPLAATAVQDPRAAPSSSTEPDQTKEIVLVQEEQRTFLDEPTEERRAYHPRVAGEPDQLPAAGDGKTTPSRLDFASTVVADNGETNRTEETATERELPLREFGEEEEDLDEMNRRFEAFIADTKEKMRLEALRPVHGSGGMRRVLSAY